MPDLFGVAGGLQQATRDQDAHALASMQVQDTASVIAARGLGMQEEGLKIETAKIALANQKTFHERMMARQQGGQGQGQGGQGQTNTPDAGHLTNSLASDLNEMASMAMDSGMPEQAKDYAIAASTLQKNQANIEKISAEQQNKNRSLVEKLLPSVHDEASWKQANMIYQMETGHPSPFASHPYDPRMIEQLKQATQTAKDTALTKAADARAKLDSTRAAESKMRTDVLIPSQAKLNTDRDKALLKNGGKDLIPKANELKVITDLAQHSFDIDATDPKQMADIRVQARPIAERMKEIMREHPELSQSEAGKRAFNEAKTRGDFAGLDRNKNLPGASANTAVDLPKDKTKAKENHWYKVNGKPMYLDGGTLFTEEEVKSNEQDLKSDEESDEEDEE